MKRYVARMGGLMTVESDLRPSPSACGGGQVARSVLSCWLRSMRMRSSEEVDRVDAQGKSRIKKSREVREIAHVGVAIVGMAETRSSWNRLSLQINTH